MQLQKKLKCLVYLLAFNRNCQSSGTTVRSLQSASNNRWRHCRRTKWQTSGENWRNSKHDNKNSAKNSARWLHSPTVVWIRMTSWTRSVRLIAAFQRFDFC